MLSFIYGIVAFLLGVVNSLAVVLGWILVIVTVLKVVLGQKGFADLRQKVFAIIMVKALQPDFKKIMKIMKDELFSSLKNVKSADAQLRSKGAVNILEVGVGGGTNLEYFPPGSRLLCVDPNVSFEAYFHESCAEKAAHLDPAVRFVVGRGEHMPEVEDNSVDVVVVTLVLCSVDHMDSILREIRRVLVPGGRFYFLEHMGGHEGTWRRRIQDLLTDCGLWPALLDGCLLNRRMEPAILAAGFSDVDMHAVAIQKETGKMLPEATHGAGGFMLNPMLYGVATK